MVYGDLVPDTPSKKVSSDSRDGLRHKTIFISVIKYVSDFLLGMDKKHIIFSCCFRREYDKHISTVTLLDFASIDSESNVV